MYRAARAIPCLLAAALTSACGETGPDRLNAPSAAAGALSIAPVERPHGGSCTTAFTFVSGTRLQMEYTCQLRHLGRTTAVATQDLAFGPGGITITNTTVYTAANGDVLYATFAGTGAPRPGRPDIVDFTGDETYAGGTGRFASANGSASLNGSATITGPGGTGAFVLDGTLGY